jgi:hypothetical protein
MWHHLFSNHAQVDAVFAQQVPGLSAVAVCELLFESGERLRFSADLPVATENLPSKWQAKGFNAVQFRFNLALISAPEMVGIPLSPAECEVAFQERRFRLTSTERRWSIEGAALLDSVQAVPYKSPEPGHAFSWFGGGEG